MHTFGRLKFCQKNGGFQKVSVFRERYVPREYLSFGVRIDYLNANFVAPPFCFITILPKAFIFSVVIMLLDSTLFVSIA